MRLTWLRLGGAFRASHHGQVVYPLARLHGVGTLGRSAQATGDALLPGTSIVRRGERGCTSRRIASGAPNPPALVMTACPSHAPPMVVPAARPGSGSRS